jgi:hypothetical protein
MFKKFTSIVIGVWMMALMVTGVAVADDGAPTGAEHHPHRRGGGGEITALGADNFTLTGPRGNTRTFYVDAVTEFLDQDVQPLAFTDLEIGQRAVVAAARADGDRTLAMWVRVFPPRLDYKGFGTVDSLDASEPAFEFTNRRGRTWEFYVDEATQYTDRDGGTHTFEELQPGDKVFVKAERRDDGQWWATQVSFRLQQPPPQP